MLSTKIKFVVSFVISCICTLAFILSEENSFKGWAITGFMISSIFIFWFFIPDLIYELYAKYIFSIAIKEHVAVPYNEISVRRLKSKCRDELIYRCVYKGSQFYVDGDVFFFKDYVEVKGGIIHIFGRPPENLIISRNFPRK